MGLNIVLQEPIQMNKNLADTKWNMLGNLDFTLQLKSKVLAYSQVANFLCSKWCKTKLKSTLT
jgi:hypothetical protein